MQKEIKKGGFLHDKNGNLNQTGFAKKLILTYDRERIAASKLKIKEWDYYLIYDASFAVALTIADNGYMGLLSASVIDFSKPCETTKSVMNLFPLGKIKLSPSSKSGVVHFKNRKVEARFETLNKKRKLFFKMKKFQDGNDLECEFELFDEPDESMMISTPFSQSKKCFYLNQKIVGMHASGTAKLGDRTIDFSPISTHAILDWGRGVWPRKNTWFWSAGCGWHDGKVFGFNLGYGFGDNKMTTENMLFFDGKASKLEKVEFFIPKTIDGKDDFLKPWVFKSNDKRFEMTFKPILNRHSFSSAVIISSLQNQVFGKFSGYCVLDSGEKLVIKNFLGFAEKVQNTW